MNTPSPAMLAASAPPHVPRAAQISVEGPRRFPDGWEKFVVSDGMFTVHVSIPTTHHQRHLYAVVPRATESSVGRFTGVSARLRVPFDPDSGAIKTARGSSRAVRAGCVESDANPADASGIVGACKRATGHRVDQLLAAAHHAGLLAPIEEKIAVRMATLERECPGCGDPVPVVTRGAGARARRANELSTVSPLIARPVSS